MKRVQPLQSIVDPFAIGCGAEIVDDLLMDKSNPPPHADYLFREKHVIAELKALENDSFGEPFCNKMGGLMARWMRQGLFLVCGTTRVDLRQLPLVCQEEALRVIGEPLRNKVLATANQQIRETKKLLDRPGAKGLLMVASDETGIFSPTTFGFSSRAYFRRNTRMEGPNSHTSTRWSTSTLEC